MKRMARIACRLIVLAVAFVGGIVLSGFWLGWGDIEREGDPLNFAGRFVAALGMCTAAGLAWGWILRLLLRRLP
jgi:hypothetical protein